jgi:hypothetical protein
MSDKLKMLKYSMQYGELWGSSLEYPVIKTVDGQVVGMILGKDSPYVHAFVAAPEMLEALKQIAKWHDYEESTHELAMRMYWSSRLAYDLIAKAEGRQE